MPQRKIRIADRPLTAVGIAALLPDVCVLAQVQDGAFKNFWTVQNPSGKFLSVQPDGSYAWVDEPKGVYENFPGLQDGCIRVEYGAPPDQSLPIAFRIPYFGA